MCHLSTHPLPCRSVGNALTKQYNLIGATVSCVNFAVFAGHFRVQHWRPWSPHSSCPRSTTATWLLQIYVPQYERDRVQSVVNAAARLTACPQIQPCDTTSDGLTLAAGACHNVSSIQAVCAGVRLPERNSTGILVRPDSIWRQYHTSSASLSVDLWSGGTTNPSRINRRPRVCRCMSTSVVPADRLSVLAGRLSVPANDNDDATDSKALWKLFERYRLRQYISI